MTRCTTLLSYAAALAIGFSAVSLTGAARGQDAPAPEAAQDEGMDLGLLRERLLKMWIVEVASDRHNQRRIAQKAFKGMTPIEGTGDIDLDEDSKKEFLKNDKHLRHYLLLELDASIEVIDICRAVLGTAPQKPDSDADDKALRELLDQELKSDFVVSNTKLEDAIARLGRILDVPTRVKGIAKNEDVRIDLTIPAGFMVNQTLEFIDRTHSIDYALEDGVLVVTYKGDGT